MGSPESGWTGPGHHHHQKTVSSFLVHKPMVPLLGMKVSFLSGSAVSQKMRTKHSLRSSRDGDKLSHWPFIEVNKQSKESATSLESLSLSTKGFFFFFWIMKNKCPFSFNQVSMRDLWGRGLLFL